MYKILYIILISFIVANCSFKKVVKHHGVHYLEKKQANLFINKSNKNDIIKLLGAPSTKSILEDDLWIYIENRKSKSSILKLGKEVVLTNNVLVLAIDSRGILKNKKFYNIDDLNELSFNKNETKMSDKDSFVYGVISSLKQKIDSPKRKK